MSTLDSIFDCTSLPTVDDCEFQSLVEKSPIKNSEADEAIESLPPARSSLGAPFANPEPISQSLPNRTSVSNTGMLHNESISRPSWNPLHQEFAHLKSTFRLHVLREVSRIFATLAAIEVKYSELVKSKIGMLEVTTESTSHPLDKPADHIPQNLQPENLFGHIRDFLIHELSAQVDRVNGYILELDSKFESVANALTTRNQILERENAELKVMVDRLKCLY